MSRNSFFQFKQFRIIQEKSAMKVGMDGVLLGAWVDASGASRILDIGTGTGLIALMMAQKNQTALIDAIEIDSDACVEATFNAAQSPWAERIQMSCISFQDFVEDNDWKYNLIVSNPPFFAQSGLKAPHENRAQARHSDSLPLETLISGSADILNDNGCFVLILPYECRSKVEQLARDNRLFLSRICNIKPNPKKKEFRIMVELVRYECAVKEEFLLIEYEQHHDYTAEYKNLTSDFYLRF
jgi:tRNA1Val (adenine37-N6)-methyltransferase